MKMPNSSRRQFLKTAGLTGLGLTMAACVPAAAPGMEGAADEEPVELSLWGWWDIRMDLYRSVADKFAEQNDRITVDVQSIAGGYVEKLYSALAAGTGPNMIKMRSLAFMHQMREENLVLEFPEDIFPPSWFEEAYPLFDIKTNGRYVLPTGTTCTLLMYNKQMFEEAGLDPESPPKTWDDFTTAAKALTQKAGTGAIERAGFALTGEWPVLSQIYQLGGNVIQNNGDEQISLMTSPEVHEAFTYITDLSLVHEVWDPGFPNFDSIGNGLAAMTEEQTWVVGEYVNTYPDMYPNIGYSHPPTPSGEPDPLYGYKDTVTSISAVTGHPENDGDTWEFMEFLYKDGGKDAYWALCELISLVPERADLMSDPRLLETPGLKEASEVNPHERNYAAVPERAGSVQNDVIHLIMNEGRTVAEALEYGDAEIQKLIDEGLAKYWV